MAWNSRLSRRTLAYPLLSVERLEERNLPAITGVLTAGALVVNGDVNAFNHIYLTLDTAKNQIDLSDGAGIIGRFDNAAVTSITVNANGLNNYVSVDKAITTSAALNGGPGTNVLIAGGGPTTLVSGTGQNRLVGGAGTDVFTATQGDNTIENGTGTSTINLGPRASQVNTGSIPGLTPSAGNPLVNRIGRDKILGFKDRTVVNGLAAGHDSDLRATTTPPDLSQTLGIPPSPAVTITSSEVGTLLSRAAAATPGDNAIVAIVDRGGRILGVRVEGNVDPAITGNTQNLVFAIDGALAEARTGAFFGNNQAPLTSRTIQYISQSTITQREVESNPSITDPNSTVAGPGVVAPIGIGGHFPPGIQYTPQVDLADIELTNRDTTLHRTYDANGNVVSYTALPQRFNVSTTNIPDSILTAGDTLAAPDSYGFISGLEPNSQPRGIGTLPGGIPIVKNGVVVGGIGVFFPGKTGYADEENSALSSNYNKSKPDLSLTAEYVAFAALGGSSGAGFTVGNLGGIAPLKGFDLPNGRIDLVGITLPLFGPDGTNGPGELAAYGQTLAKGDPNSGFNAALGGGVTLKNGTLVPEGWLVKPHAGTTLTAADVTQMITQGVQQAEITRAAIRLPQDSTSVMVFAVADQKTGEILGLFRMPDSTIFSIDVAVAKARNVAYYADVNQLQTVDQAPGVAKGVAFTNRTFRYLELPRYPEGIDGAPPGAFSILNVAGTDPNTGLNTGAPVAASAYYNNVAGHDAFFPQTNFHDPNNPLNQNGIIFFPGSVPLYKNGKLAGGVGISGDGVDQDDVVTFATKQGFDTPSDVLTADQVFVSGVRLPYQKFNRQPLEEPAGGSF